MERQDGLMDLHRDYRSRIDRIDKEIAVLKRRDSMLLTAEIVMFVAFLASAFMLFYTSFRMSWLCVVIPSFAAYLLSRTLDRKNGDRKSALQDIRQVLLDELSYLDGDFSPFDDGSDYVDAVHPYTFDLDIFGRNSLFQRINRTVTSGGRGCLAGSLSTLPSVADESTLSAIRDKSDAIAELSADDDWLVHFIAIGKGAHDGGRLIDSEQIKRSVDETAQLGLERIGHSRAVLVVTCLSVAVLVALSVASAVTTLSGNIPVAWACLQFVVALAVTGRILKQASDATDALHSQFGAFVRLMEHLHQRKFTSRLNAGMQSALFGDGNDAMRAFKELSAIANALTRRGNGVWIFLSDALLMNDVFLVRRLYHWQTLYINKVCGWIDALARMDALVSMAVFRYNEPQSTVATVVRQDKVVYVAQGIWHPFVGAKAVKNDFSIADGNFYIITGANMAGKSTFLRSVGLNYVLALNGMPVFADSLRVSVFNLFTNMRTTDDLTRGISYFNAELLRLKQLMENCREHGHSLIILDEILKGTNSLDKLNGSVSFLETVSRLPVSGVIATHDLELSRMADRYPQRFHDYCFEIGLADRITYSYKITPGVARNQNATFLLQNIIDEVFASGRRKETQQ